MKLPKTKAVLAKCRAEQEGSRCKHSGVGGSLGQTASLRL